MAPVVDEQVLGCGNWCGDNGINGFSVPVAQTVPSRNPFCKRRVPLLSEWALFFAKTGSVVPNNGTCNGF